MKHFKCFKMFQMFQNCKIQAFELPKLKILMFHFIKINKKNGLEKSDFLERGEINKECAFLFNFRMS